MNENDAREKLREADEEIRSNISWAEKHYAGAEFYEVGWPEIRKAVDTLLSTIADLEPTADAPGEVEAIQSAIDEWTGGSPKDREKPMAELIASRLAALRPQSPDAVELLQQSWPLGTEVIKPNGPEWRGKVVGYYSSTFTPEGLVIENTSDGARGQVHVEPAKRIDQFLQSEGA